MLRSRQTAAEILFIALAPIVGFFALQICLINQDFYIDAWFYTGYGQEFKTFQHVFGWTYYAVRFPVILLNLAVPRGVDPVIGFAIVRYLVFMSCGVPLYLWARHHFGIACAIAAYLFLFCNPLFPRLLLWDLTPFVSVPAALAGMTLWQLPTKNILVNRGLCGFAFCASVASHAFTGTAIAVFLVVEAARRLIKREYRDLVVLDVAATVTGAAVCLAIGAACYYMIVGPFDPSVFVTMTLNAIRAGDEVATSHSHELSAWIWQNTNALVPLILVGFVAIGFTRDLVTDTVVARVWWFGFLYCAFYAAYQFLFHRFVLEIFFYFFHLSLVVYLLFPVCLYLITRNLTFRSRGIVVGIAIAVLILTAMYRDYFLEVSLADVSRPNFGEPVPGQIAQILEGQIVQIPLMRLKDILMRFEVLSAIGGIVLILAVYLVRRVAKTPVVAAVYAITLAASVQFLTLSAPAFGVIYAKPWQAKEYDMYRAAVEMVRVFGGYATPSSRVMLWYRMTSSNRSIASTVLSYGVNRPYLPGGLPDIGEYERSRLGLPGLKYIMMMSENPEAIAKGKEALSLHGYDFHDVEDRTLGGGSFKTQIDLIELGDRVPRAR